MPEGDTVHLAASRLDAALKGRIVERSDLRVPRVATVDLSGDVVDEVVARGKHLFFRFAGGLSLHSHFKMEGSWHLYRPGTRWRGPQHEVRAVLATQGVVAVGYRLSGVEVVPTAEEDRFVGHLGPDVLGPDWDTKVVQEAMASDPSRPIEEVLLDQGILAGVGNVYKSEVCFLAGVHPRTPVGEIDLERVISVTKRTMEANRTTGRQVTTGDDRAGRRHWVYGRGGDPCSRCGDLIRRAAPQVGTSQRVTYWCPSCQPLTEGT